MQNQSLKQTVLHKNSFWLLGVTVRDDKRRIIEMSEEKSLELDHELCQKAQSDLTSPRKRLEVEMAWLPGVSPRKAMQLADLILKDPMYIRGESGLPPLAHANLMAAAFEAIDPEEYYPSDISEFINEMAYIVDEITVDAIIRVINEDRAVSVFPDVRAQDHVEEELVERKRYFKNVIKDALNRLPPQSLVEVSFRAQRGILSLYS